MQRLPPPIPRQGPPAPRAQPPSSSPHFTSPPPGLPPHGQNVFPSRFMPPSHPPPQHLPPYPGQNPATAKPPPENFQQPPSNTSFHGQGAPPLPPNFMPPPGFPPPPGFGGAPSHPHRPSHVPPQGPYPPMPHQGAQIPTGPPPPIPQQGMPPPAPLPPPPTPLPPTPTPMSLSGPPPPVPLSFSSSQRPSAHNVQRPPFLGPPPGMVAVQPPQVSSSNVGFSGGNPHMQNETGRAALPATFSIPPPQSSLGSYGHAANHSVPQANHSVQQLLPPCSNQMEPQPSASVQGGTDDPIVQRQMDKEWVEGWVRQRRHWRTTEKPKMSSLKICEAQAALKQALQLLARLRTQREALQNTASDDDTAWRKGKEEAEATKRELDTQMKNFRDKNVVEALKSKIALRTSKRARLRRQRQQRWEEQQLQQQEWATTEARIDQWQTDLHQKDLEKKQEAEMKKAADSTLAEVRRKQAEAERTLDLLQSLQKLRKIRRDAAERHGSMFPNAYSHDKKFEERIAKLQTVIENQKTVYEGEEKTLKVMLEIEQEETKEKEREQQRLQETRQASRQHRAQLEMLFGKTEDLDSDEEMLPFRQFYDQAQHSLEAFLQIRREWDAFLVPPGTPGASTIPQTWVLPPQPSSDAWEKALQD